METDMQTNSSALSVNTNQCLESFLLLAKTVRGAALKALIKQVLEASGVYVFGELLELTCVQEMKDDPDSCKMFELLNIFAYGTFQDYVSQAASMPVLSPLMSKKLRCLTIVTLAAKSKYISYASLLEQLHLKNIRELEDMLISAIYADIIHGRLDQQNSRLEVDWTIGRDLTPSDVSYILDTLSSWCSSCETMLLSIETQVSNASTFLSQDAAKKAQINIEIENIKSTIKKTSGHELDMSTSESRIASNLHPAPSAGFEIKPKKSKVKGLRGSGMKLWSKN